MDVSAAWAWIIGGRRGVRLSPGSCQGRRCPKHASSLGALQVNNNGVNNDASGNLNQLLITYPDPTNTTNTDPVNDKTGWDTAQLASNSAPGALQFTSTSDVATLAAGQSLQVPIYLSLEGGTSPSGFTLPSNADPNAWNGAAITIPFTVTATAGS